MEEKVNVLIKRPDEKISCQVIDNTLDKLQELVGGWIETVFLPHNIFMIVNEEGKLNGLPINFILPWGDPVMGTVIFASLDEEGDFKSLSADLVSFIKSMFKAG